MVFNYNANGPFFSASANTTLHTTRVNTSIVFGTAGISNICSDSPGGGPGTIGFSALARVRILRGRLRIVSTATTSLYVSGNVGVLIFGLSGPRGVISTVINRPVNAVMGWVWKRGICRQTCWTCEEGGSWGAQHFKAQLWVCPHEAYGYYYT